MHGNIQLVFTTCFHGCCEMYYENFPCDSCSCSRPVHVVLLYSKCALYDNAGRYFSILSSTQYPCDDMIYRSF